MVYPSCMTSQRTCLRIAAFSYCLSMSLLFHASLIEMSGFFFYSTIFICLHLLHSQVFNRNWIELVCAQDLPKYVCTSPGGKTRLTEPKSERHHLLREDVISNWVVKVCSKETYCGEPLWAVFLIGMQTKIPVVQYLDLVAMSKTQETRRDLVEFELNLT